jgi:MtN3 and saliva related transmembrane protein
MASPFVEGIGALAGIMTTLCLIPQAVKIIREKETRAISLPATLLSTASLLLWLVYGAAIVDAPLIGSSSITFVVTAAILVLKIRHG